ncbi:MAG: hypothetical protein E2P05_08275 [Acidobacteria bacterium]|nr:MAG: hypothetical protein E2P05_08275 [Acidobacteriota bacterium]
MQRLCYRSNRGFTIFELVVAMGLATVVLGGALALTSQAIGISDMVSHRSDMQQNARVAINMIARDASLAGTGFPAEGVQLPGGTGSQDSHFACDEATGCHLTNNNDVYTDERLYATWPGQAGGPTINGVATDVITMVYDDPTSNFDQFVFTDMDANGKKIYFDPATTPAWNHAVLGLQVGDVILLNNSIGIAAATVTRLHDDHVHIDPGSKDPLDINQQGQSGFGSAVHIYGPPTTARRIYIVTYYIDNSDPNIPMLMRHVSGHPPMAVAEYVENLQVTYDIFDDDASVATAALVDAGGQPNQIRKINITLTVRSPGETMIGRDFQRITLTTSVGPRNMTYRDRYE